MCGGFGGMMSIRVKGGPDAAAQTAKRTKLFFDATSLGGVESLIEHRGPIEGPDSPTQQDLLRLSVGLENAQDLLDDLDQALGQRGGGQLSRIGGNDHHGMRHRVFVGL